MSALLIQSPGDTVQTGTEKVEPACKFKCTTAPMSVPLLTLIMKIAGHVAKKR